MAGELNFAPLSMFVLFFLYLYDSTQFPTLKLNIYEDQELLQGHSKAYNRAYNVIDFDEYKAKMIADVPATKNLIIWSWVAPVLCNSNALFICSFNGLLEGYGEQCNYCEEIVISKKALKKSQR